MISQHFYPEIGSAGNRMKNLYQLWIEEGYEVDVLTIDPSYPNNNLYSNTTFWDHEDLNNEKDNIKRVTISKRKHSKNMFKRLMFFIEVTFKMLFEIITSRDKYDHIYVSSPPIFIALVGLLAKYRMRSRLVLEVRDLWPESLKGVNVFNIKGITWLFSMIEKTLYRRSDVIVVNSIGFITYIQKKASIPLEKIYYIPNAARKYEMVQEVNKDNEFKVIYTGNVGLAQNVSFLKEIAKKLNRSKIPFTIIGYGVKLKEFQEFTAENDLYYVSFINPLTRKQCLEEIQKHKVGIVSLNNKNVFDTVLPGKVIDYMTCNVPIVGSVSGYTKDLIINKDVGYVSETRSVDEVVDYIKYLEANPKTHAKMASNCANYIKNDFLWEKNIKVFEDIFNVKNG